MFIHSYLSRTLLLELTATSKNSIVSFLSSSLLLSKTLRYFTTSIQQQRVAAPRSSITTIVQKQGSLRSFMAGNLDGRVNSMRWPNAILFGDSITQYGFSHDGCWVALIADFLQRKCDVFNRGFSGYNSRWCKKILSSILSSEDLKDTVFVTIFLGANDCADKDINPHQHVPVDEYKTNMCAIVKEFEHLGIPAEKIILISPPVVDEDTWAKECKTKGRPLSNFNKNTSLYAKACVEAAQQTGTHCIDLYTEMLKHDDWKSMLNDGLHLSNKGSHFLFSLLRPIVGKHTSHLPFKLPYWGDVDPENLNSLLD